MSRRARVALRRAATTDTPTKRSRRPAAAPPTDPLDRTAFAAEILKELDAQGIRYWYVDHDGEPLVASLVSKDDRVTPEQAARLHAQLLRGLARRCP